MSKQKTVVINATKLANISLLKEMAVFAQVIDNGGFSAAARHLEMTTSSVSRHVSRLESHLGARLLERTTRALAPTELGHQVYAACSHMMETAREIHDMVENYSERPTGVIRVSAPVVFGTSWLAPRLPSFLDLYPEVDIRLTLVDRAVDLIEEGVDLAVRIARNLPPGLIARRCCDMRFVLIASSDYLSRHASLDHPDGLNHHRCIYLSDTGSGESWALQRGNEIVDFISKARLTINNSAAIVAVVQAGGGIGLVPDFAAQAALQARRVELVLSDWKLQGAYTGAIHLVYMPGRHLPQKVRALIDHLVSTPLMPPEAT